MKRIRVTFLHKDDQFLYVQSNEPMAKELLKVRYAAVDVNAEFNDTVALLWPQAQLNLLDVSIDETGVLIPQFIVLEPDYLLDASLLAECYKNYGAHPANYLMSRLTPSENTIPLILGNIANTFLDEWINDDSPDYKESMMKAFRQHPVSISACTTLQDAIKERELAQDCQKHFRNIRQTVSVTFHEPGYQLDKTDAVLEPSYICEALGIQGRLDYMQRDMHAFIEMKSGKADEFTLPGHVLPRENNLVQMLLYQAMLEYTMGIYHRQSLAYLLYTRYPMLYPARPSWTMVHRIINLRNRIVAKDYQVQAHDEEDYTAEVLAQINPQTLNEQKQSSKLWIQFQEPQIAAFQHSLQQLTALERSYFYTLYNFITRELYTAKTAGASDYEGRKGQATQWLSTFQEKQDTGEIVADLHLVENRADDTANPYLMLRSITVNGHFLEQRAQSQTCLGYAESRQNRTMSIVNFREGDAIVLYRRDTPDANVTNQMLFKGSIEEINPDGTWKIMLRQPQRNHKVLPPDSLYAFEHDFMDTTFRSMYQGLALFLQASQQRRDLLLGQRPPKHDARYDKAITEAKDDFQRITQKALAARDYFLLVGPPGTGKTSMALRSMVDAFHRRGKQILLLSYTNRAVDEICKMLDKLSVDYLRIGTTAACAEPYRSHLLEQRVTTCANRREVVQLLEDCSIFVGTTSTLSARTSLFNIKHFDVALIDEATQILESQLLGLLCIKDGKGHDAIGKFILIGDHKQLPAVVLQPSSASEVKNPLLRAIGLTNLKDSLFERLYRTQNSQFSILNLYVLQADLGIDIVDCAHGEPDDDVGVVALLVVPALKAGQRAAHDFHLLADTKTLGSDVYRVFGIAQHILKLAHLILRNGGVASVHRRTVQHEPVHRGIVHQDGHQARFLCPHKHLPRNDDGLLLVAVAALVDFLLHKAGNIDLITALLQHRANRPFLCGLALRNIPFFPTCFHGKAGAFMQVCMAHLGIFLCVNTHHRLL